MQKKKNSGAVTTILAIILFFLFCSGVLYIISVQTEYQKAERIYKNIQTDFTEEEAEFHIDWKKLKALNPDITAWIDIPGTKISYPVLQGKDNNEYLRQDIYRKYSKSGSIFIDSRNTKPFEDFNTIIYGHNLQSHSIMFSNLRKYNKVSFAEKHPIVYIYLPDETCLEYKIISFHIVKADDSDIYCTDVSDTASFLRAVNKNNRLNPDIDENKIKSVITLSTCTNADQNERFVLHAVQVE